jgi:GT2 family glycosyltransferase
LPGRSDSDQGGATLSVVVVTHDSADAVSRSLPAIAAQLRDGDELIVCDNASTDGTPERARDLVPGARIVETGANLGYGAANNRGAELACGELLLFLNPDAVVGPGFRDAIELPLREGRGWAAWQGLVTAGEGSEVNTWGGVVHFSGIAWAGGAGRPIAEAPETPGEVAFASGACLAIRRAEWEAAGPFAPGYFLYHEDVELSLRLWLLGRRVGVEPRARCEHDYEFDKGPGKWLHLERNRWATLLRTYPAPLLVAIAPALLAIEIALVGAAAAGRWLPQKLRADAQAVRALPRLLRERRGIRSRAAAAGSTPIGAARFAARLQSGLDSAFLGRAGGSRLLGRLLAAYWRFALALIGGR